MKKIYYLLILMLLSSCYTAKVAQRQVIKAQLTFPEVTSLFCAETFPITERIVETTKVIKGETEFIKGDDILIDCDSIVANPKTTNKVKVPTKQGIRVDTVYIEKQVLKENTAKTKNLQLQLQAKEKIIAENNDTIKTQKRKLKDAYWIIGIMALVILGLIFIKR